MWRKKNKLNPGNTGIFCFYTMLLTIFIRLMFLWVIFTLYSCHKGNYFFHKRIDHTTQKTVEIRKDSSYANSLLVTYSGEIHETKKDASVENPFVSETHPIIHADREYKKNIPLSTRDICKIPLTRYSPKKEKQGSNLHMPTKNQLIPKLLFVFAFLLILLLFITLVYFAGTFTFGLALHIFLQSVLFGLLVVMISGFCKFLLKIWTKGLQALSH